MVEGPAVRAYRRVCDGDVCQVCVCQCLILSCACLSVCMWPCVQRVKPLCVSRETIKQPNSKYNNNNEYLERLSVSSLCVYHEKR